LRTVEVMIELAVVDDSSVAQARRAAQARGVAVAFDEVRVGQLAIVATELATNIVKHGGGGTLLVGDGEAHVDLLALDRGPGMADVAKCLADGYSSAGTLGNGLGAVRRLSQAFAVASWPGLGTGILARVVRQGAAPPTDSVGGLSVPKRGEDVCGDGWWTQARGSDCSVLVVDGLGHGPEAARAAHEALRVFQRNPAAPPAESVQSLHLALRHTRGGALAVASIDAAAGTVTYAGLGNIAALLVPVNGPPRHLVSLNGIAGHNARKIHAFEYPCGQGLLIMHSDGIGTGWKPERYPGFTHLHPLLLSGLLFRDFARGRDDATVVVVKLGPA
jgi:anti-sigma regulatory factor (Ser/Thr protein kinase)